ncbi:hypothetical protein N865_06200 [Intrasporangium oryzae NRRL B-24470]|uniref:DUF222 domain-containing protein n=1 Tax=Intrasporangium oryzae NRRL B-24470 TaxID=1386089 RepID=W9GEV1_9MICO|nr:HNH endonuclease signature motif containing protein [Intrasporangium oryzae]EWT02404.1 hypothetical protein N865_06200 [Intrasporangium oryzae NRRL B-24470]
MPFIDVSLSPLERATAASLTAAGVLSVSAAGEAVGTRVDRFVSLARAADAALAQIEALEVEKARLEGRLVDAYAALTSIQEQQHAGAALVGHNGVVPVSVSQIVTQEIALATGVGVGEVSRRLALATAPRRHRVMRAALRRGDVSLARALQVVSETSALPDEVMPALEEALLAPGRDGHAPSQRTFTTRLRRCVRSADARGQEELRLSAAGSRTVYGRLTEDGLGVLTVVAPAERVVAILDRADEVARAVRASGDERTLEQLRCDVVCDLLLHGWLTDGLRAGDATASGGPGSWGRPPKARVWIVVPFEVAAGLSDAACEIPGHGWVTAAHAREIMTAPDSVWQRLAVDVDTGRALELSSDRYVPSRAMVDHVRAVDGVCRGPGCEVPAHRCDLDHEVPWPRGRTEVGNLHAKHRFCHNTKTARLWRSEPTPDDALTWTTLAGRRYVTYPKDWRAALRGPGPGHDNNTGTDRAVVTATVRGAPAAADDPPPF